MASVWLLLFCFAGVTAGGALDALKPSTFSYTEKLLGDAMTMSDKIGELLAHGEALQVLETSCKLLHRPPKKKEVGLVQPLAAGIELAW